MVTDILSAFSALLCALAAGYNLATVRRPTGMFWACVVCALVNAGFLLRAAHPPVAPDKPTPVLAEAGEPTCVHRWPSGREVKCWPGSNGALMCAESSPAATEGE